MDEAETVCSLKGRATRVQRAGKAWPKQQKNRCSKMARLPLHAHPQGAAAQQALVSRAQQYMIRRTSETLKQYLPAKVQEVRADVPGRAAD